MPILFLKVSGLLAADQHRQLAEAATDLTATILHKKHELTAVLLDVVPPEAWSIGGQTLREHGLASFALTIKVTAGTNSAEEKAAFVEAVYARMAGLLGPLHEASYVVVEDVPGTDWGYGGRTQSHRAAARPIEAA